jgi:hypothetical protein
MTTTYQIGQVLYIISETAKKVIPVQVQEIHKKQTIAGEEVIYMVMDPQETGPHDLSSIDGEIRTNPKDVAQFLKNSAGKAIDEMVNRAAQVAAEKFGAEDTSIFKPVPKLPLPPILTPKPKTGGMSRPQEKEESGEMIETIGPDGQIQKMKIRSIQGPS